MPLTPEEQAKAATKIGEIEQEIANVTTIVRSLEDDWGKDTDRELASYREELKQLHEEANTLRAHIGVPLVIPGTVTSPTSPGSSVLPTTTPQQTSSARFGLVILVGLAIWFVISRLSAPAQGTLRSSAPSLDVPTTRTVTYFVSGVSTSSASLTYENAQGGSEQHEVTLPWRLSFEAAPGQYLYLSAQNQEAYGSIDCAIVAGNETVQRASSNGGYVIATCSGRTP